MQFSSVQTDKCHCVTTALRRAADQKPSNQSINNQTCRHPVVGRVESCWGRFRKCFGTFVKFNRRKSPVQSLPKKKTPSSPSCSSPPRGGGRCPVTAWKQTTHSRVSTRSTTRSPLSSRVLAPSVSLLLLASGDLQGQRSGVRV